MPDQPSKANPEVPQGNSFPIPSTGPSDERMTSTNTSYVLMPQESEENADPTSNATSDLKQAHTPATSVSVQDQFRKMKNSSKQNKTASASLQKFGHNTIRPFDNESNPTENVMEQQSENEPPSSTMTYKNEATPENRKRKFGATDQQCDRLSDTPPKQQRHTDGGNVENFCSLSDSSLSGQKREEYDPERNATQESVSAGACIETPVEVTPAQMPNTYPVGECCNPSRNMDMDNGEIMFREERIIRTATIKGHACNPQDMFNLLLEHNQRQSCLAIEGASNNQDMVATQKKVANLLKFVSPSLKKKLDERLKDPELWKMVLEVCGCQDTKQLTSSRTDQLLALTGSIERLICTICLVQQRDTEAFDGRIIDKLRVSIRVLSVLP